MVQTNDMQFSGQTVSFNVKVLDDSVDILPLAVSIQFSSPPPQFDRDGFKVDPVTCSVDDESWAVPLPPIKDADTQSVTIEFKSVSELFVYVED